MSQKIIDIKSPEQIKENQVLIQSFYPRSFSRLLVENVEQIDKNHTLISSFDGQGLLHKDLIYHRDNERMLIAKLTEIEQFDVPRIVMDASKKQEKIVSDAQYFSVRSVHQGPSYFAIKSSGEMFFYSSLGRSMKPLF